MFDRSVLYFLPFQIEDGDVVIEPRQQFGQGRIGSPDTAIADRPYDVFCCYTDTQARRLPIEFR